MSHTVRSVFPAGFDFGACLSKARAGDDKSIGDLIQGYMPYLHAALLRHMRHDRRLRDSDDIFQTTIEHAIERICKCRASSECQFRRWLWRILVNSSAKSRREHKLRPMPLDECPEPADPRTEHWIEIDRERDEAAAEAFAELNVDEQLLVMWHYIHRWSWGAISRSSGRSEGAVQKAGIRALQKLDCVLHSVAPQLFSLDPTSSIRRTGRRS